MKIKATKGQLIELFGTVSAVGGALYGSLSFILQNFKILEINNTALGIAMGLMVAGTASMLAGRYYVKDYETYQALQQSLHHHKQELLKLKSDSNQKTYKTDDISSIFGLDRVQTLQEEYQDILKDSIREADQTGEWKKVNALLDKFNKSKKEYSIFNKELRGLFKKDQMEIDSLQKEINFSKKMMSDNLGIIIQKEAEIIDSLLKSNKFLRKKIKKDSSPGFGLYAD